MTDFATADLHIYHDNLRTKYCPQTRGHFKSVEDMNEGIVSNWNAKVGQDDTVRLLGDCCFGDLDKSVEYLYRLNGKIHLIRGNHDEKSIERSKRFRDRFESIDWYREEWWRHPKSGQKFFIVMCHFAFKTWNKKGKGAWNLVGHWHGNVADTPDELQIDVGLDGPYSNLAPLSFEEIANIMSKKTPKFNNPEDY